MEWSYYTPKSRHYRVAEFFGVSYLLRGFGGTFLNFLTQSLDLRYKRLALLPVCSPSLNFVVRYEFWFAVSLVLRIARGLSALPMGWLSVWPARVLTVLTTGTTRACPSSCSAYCWVALSKSVSFSKARLCVPQSKCCIMEECLRNVCVQPSSGHVNSAPRDAECSSSVSVLSSVLRIPLRCTPCAHLFTPYENELGCAWRTTKDGSMFDNGASGICDISFPVPTPYALHTRIPSSENSIFESRLTPSILYESIEGLVMESQRVTLSEGTPPEDRIASVICSGVSISCPEFR